MSESREQYDAGGPEILQVGKPYRPDKPSWPEAYEFQYDVSGYRLRLFVKGLRPVEVESVTAGPARFALSVLGDIIFFHFRFEPAFGWSDCPYTWHLNPPDRRALPSPEFEPGIGFALSVILVEATDGILRGLRLIGMGDRFTQKFHQAVLRQSARPWDETDYNKQLATAYARHTSEDLVSRAIARYKAGERPQ